ncbi:hypothetical protein HaLaN_06651 [Haematococcus lacustris]|uniref:BRCT domain-containing protein n=1 Tax=Haematococcus lacustris TaxID=44745 RepID=A0A699YMF0_HAELA|nr:hypothetical protein HaLaN_06651 [Haematococcus lacustris]
MTALAGEGEVACHTQPECDPGCRQWVPPPLTPAASCLGVLGVRPPTLQPTLLLARVPAVGAPPPDPSRQLPGGPGGAPPTPHPHKAEVVQQAVEQIPQHSPPPSSNQPPGSGGGGACTCALSSPGCARSGVCSRAACPQGPGAAAGSGLSGAGQGPSSGPCCTGDGQGSRGGGRASRSPDAAVVKVGGRASGLASGLASPPSWSPPGLKGGPGFTHLVTSAEGFTRSAKQLSALAWGKPLVHPGWLEDCRAAGGGGEGGRKVGERWGEGGDMGKVRWQDRQRWADVVSTWVAVQRRHMKMDSRSERKWGLDLWAAHSRHLVQGPLLADAAEKGRRREAGNVHGRLRSGVVLTPRLVDKESDGAAVLSGLITAAGGVALTSTGQHQRALHHLLTHASVTPDLPVASKAVVGGMKRGAPASALPVPSHRAKRRCTESHSGALGHTIQELDDAAKACRLTGSGCHGTSQPADDGSDLGHCWREVIIIGHASEKRKTSLELPAGVPVFGREALLKAVLRQQPLTQGKEDLLFVVRA